MRRLAALLLGGWLAAPLAMAQAPPEPAPPPPAPPAHAPSAKAPTGKAPEYDTKAVVTIKGVVEDIHESKMRGDHPGLHLILKTETETVEVHACPVRFMSDLEFTIEKGDALTVEGSRPEGGGIVVAREITKGQTSLILRDKTGAPVWTR
ncbi:MAG TPA: hypothetical protein VLL75_07280 [Vicinamibacteria bacterium]|nr:hypothetical protein [Vicinamibacteria bacterium]